MRTTPLTFTKYEGAGNDFIVVVATDAAVVSPEEARTLCDRHFGIGADGVLLVLPPTSPGAIATMRVLNADGSIPEMCGNGLRCVAAHVGNPQTLPELVIDTGAGPKTCIIHEHSVTIDMGTPRILGERTLLGQHLVLVETGNPHAILFGAFTPAEVERLGPQLSRHEAFPEGTNVEFARVTDHGIDLVVWERGVGLTLACGTGAVATVAAALDKELVPSGVPVSVRLPGGTLRIERLPSGAMRMTGPARKVFEGTLASAPPS
ncbi:MAG: diaminopimelate epimerase [Polyangiaceae bacterium]